MKERYKLIIPLVKTLMNFKKDEDSDRVKNLLAEIEKKNKSIKDLETNNNQLKKLCKDNKLIGVASGSALGLIGGMMIHGNNR